MFEMCEGHVPLNAKHYVSFKRSLFTLPRHIKVSQYDTELTRYESKEVGLSCSVSSSSHEIKSKPPSCCYVWWHQTIYSTSRLRSILIWRVCDWRDEVIADFSQLCKQFASFILLLCILSGFGFPGCLFWLHTIHHLKRLGVLSRMTAISAL